MTVVSFFAEFRFLSLVVISLTSTPVDFNELTISKEIFTPS